MSIQINRSVAFVTGSNRGIGKAFVEELVNKGVKKVYAAARDKNTLNSLVDGGSGKVVPVELDVTNAEQIKEVASIVFDVNLLINNAGTAGWSSIITAPDTSIARYEMEVNFYGLMNVTRAFAPILKKNGGGALVNISSIGGLVGIPMVGTYCATKAAVHSLTQSVRGELVTNKTFVAGVYPGPVDTDMAAGGDFEKETPNNVAKYVLDAIENGVEDIFPDKTSQEFQQGMKNDPKALEKKWAQMLPHGK